MSKAKILLACVVWLIILSIGVVLYRMVYVPSVAKQEEQQQEEVLEATSGNSNYSAQLSLGLDAFSGYAVLRSTQMRQQLRSRGVKMDLVDDGANYDARLAALADGKLHMAAFPIDALLKASQKRGSLPATIVAIIDETQGADAVLAYKSKFPNVDSLNHASTRFVLVGDSPSETLVRFLMNKFHLPTLSSQSLESVGSEKEVFKRYQQATPAGNEVFVTWEPVVSQMLENDQLHVLFDSHGQSGFIVDALVVNRDYLVKNQATVKDVLECYFSALYEINSSGQLTDVVLADAREQGTDISDAQAERLVQGIQWKNTQENMAHFGLRRASVAHIEDMIDGIKNVLMNTDGLAGDPTGGKSSRLFYEQILGQLHAADFHPGSSRESIREQQELAALNADQWQRLEPVGTVDVPPLIYARGTSKLTRSSQVKLDSLIATLESFPRYYLLVRGNASSRGDAEANRLLAKQRAEAALQYLLENGVPQARLRAVEGELASQTSVTFVVGQIPY